MAHLEQALFVSRCKRAFPTWFHEAKVLEIGSLIVNGSARDFFENCQYTGIDLGEGPGVDVVARGATYAGPTGGFDSVICCEAMEHDPYWQETFLNGLRMMKPDGMMLITCATLGRRQHGTPLFSPADSPHTAGQGNSYYRNLAEADFRKVGDFAQWFGWHAFFVDHVIRDLYFVGFGPEAVRHREAVPVFVKELEHDFPVRNLFGIW